MSSIIDDLSIDRRQIAEGNRQILESNRTRRISLMSKVLRLAEKWFRRGLWLVALVVAGFLIGLGGTIVGDLPKLETPLHITDLLDHARPVELRKQQKHLHQAKRDTQTALNTRQLPTRKAPHKPQP